MRSPWGVVVGLGDDHVAAGAVAAQQKALGGGALGDTAGFLAASWLRGVPLIQVPTTLVAQIDSSIGGKTGVDLAAGKNLVGAFHPPSGVVCAAPSARRPCPGPRPPPLRRRRRPALDARRGPARSRPPTCAAR